VVCFRLCGTSKCGRTCSLPVLSGIDGWQLSAVNSAKLSEFLRVLLGRNFSSTPPRVYDFRCFSKINCEKLCQNAFIRANVRDQHETNEMALLDPRIARTQEGIRKDHWRVDESVPVCMENGCRVEFGLVVCPSLLYRRFTCLTEIWHGNSRIEDITAVCAVRYFVNRIVRSRDVFL
jgi:hypothetical protein